MEKTQKRIPSLAFIVTLVIGIAFTLFSGMESISGFMERPVTKDFAVGGLLEIATFALPFFVMAWLLWFKPKIGAVLMMLAGLGFGTWMYIDWARPVTVGDWIVPAILVGIPVVLGAFTFTRELSRKGG